MWSDPISDMLTRLRNGVHVHRETVTMPKSKAKVGIAQVLQDEGYVKGFDLIDDGRQGLLRVELKYGPRGEQVIQNLQRVSRPGRRVYKGCTELPHVLDGLGVLVVSTSQGILSDRVCRERNLGGELLCTVY